MTGRPVATFAYFSSTCFIISPHERLRSAIFEHVPQNMVKPSLIQVADPMCSWCYAFEPELHRVGEATGLDIRLVMGGLFVDDRAVALDDQMRSYLDETWQRVGNMSGQPINFDLIKWPKWTYDTGPSCRAVVAMRTTAPEHAFDYFEAIQRAFYADNLDVTKTEVLIDLAESMGFGSEEFAKLATQPDLADEDYAEARALGANGFPTLILDTGTTRTPVSTGYSKADRIIRSIEVMS